MGEPNKKKELLRLVNFGKAKTEVEEEDSEGILDNDIESISSLSSFDLLDVDDTES